jgi:hypothetical protein
MIGQLLSLLVLALVMLLTGMDPFGFIPLLLVPISTLVRARWLGLVGLLLFWTISLATVKGADLTDIPRFGALTASLLLPTVMLLELVLTPHPYRIERISIWPFLVVAGLTIALASAMVVLTRIGNIGVYIGSDPTLQLFVLMSLTILFTGPFILRTGYGGGPSAVKGGQSPRKVSGATKTNK